jgi:1-acyl-sn-glycerol-3-phosphate acyltransferase
MRRLVTAGRSLIVFPEGTRSTDGRVGRFKRGTFLVAIEAQLPVVPISISGSRHVMMKGRLMVCPGDVRVTVHAPLATDGVAREQASDFTERVRSIVREGVEEPSARTEVNPVPAV